MTAIANCGRLCKVNFPKKSPVVPYPSILLPPFLTPVAILKRPRANVDDAVQARNSVIKIVSPDFARARSVHRALKCDDVQEND